MSLTKARSSPRSRAEERRTGPKGNRKKNEFALPLRAMRVFLPSFCGSVSSAKSVVSILLFRLNRLNRVFSVWSAWSAVNSVCLTSPSESFVSFVPLCDAFGHPLAPTPMGRDGPHYNSTFPTMDCAWHATAFPSRHENPFRSSERTNSQNALERRNIALGHRSSGRLL